MPAKAGIQSDRYHPPRSPGPPPSRGRQKWRAGVVCLICTTSHCRKSQVQSGSLVLARRQLVACVVNVLRWASLTHAIDRFVGRPHRMCEKLVIDDRRLIAVAPYRMPRSSGCVLDYCNLEALLDEIAQMGLDTHVRQHATKDDLANSSFSQLQD